MLCALVESKYAAVIAGGRTVDNLIEDCRALVKVHHDMTKEQRTAIDAALIKCKNAYQERNVPRLRLAACTRVAAGSAADRAGSGPLTVAGWATLARSLWRALLAVHTSNSMPPMKATASQALTITPTAPPQAPSTALAATVAATPRPSISLPSHGDGRPALAA